MPLSWADEGRNYYRAVFGEWSCPSGVGEEGEEEEEEWESAAAASVPLPESSAVASGALPSH